MRILQYFVVFASLTLGWISAASAQEAGDFEGRMRGFIDKASAAVTDVNDRYEAVRGRIRIAQDAEAASRELIALRDQARLAAEMYGERSEIWDDYAGLMDFVIGRQDNALARFQETGNPRWRMQYNGWTERANALQILRTNVLAEAARTRSLSAQFDDDYELILDVLLGEGVTAALSELEEVYAGLIAVNTNLELAIADARTQLLGTPTGQ
jgi:hypothetical protein